MMIRNTMRSFIWVALAVFFLSQCTTKNNVVIDGQIKGAKGKVLFLSKIGMGGPVVVDSLALKGNEKFAFKVEKPEYPEFYYLRLDSFGGLTLLVDTVENIHVVSRVPRLMENASVQGSPSSEGLHNGLLAIKNERKQYNAFVEQYNALPVGSEREVLMDGYVEHLKAFKDSLGREILSQSWSMASYYILYQKLSDKFLLYDPYIKQDYKYFGAVATGLNLKYPDDPRVKAFYKMTLAAFKEQRAAKMQKLISEAEVGIPEIALPNLEGDTMRLSDLQGKVVVLNFWVSTAHSCRLWNKTLANAYGKYRGRGLEIYQVSVDKSKILWEKALKDDRVNWISVGDYENGSTQQAMSYNVKELPTTFVIDRNGDITGRFDDEKSLMAELQRLF